MTSDNSKNFATTSRPPELDAVLLVYSGGLDTSICIPFVRNEYGYKRVVTVTVDTLLMPKLILPKNFVGKQFRPMAITRDIQCRHRSPAL